MKIKEKHSGILNFSDYRLFRYRLIYYFILLILFLAVLVSILPILWLFISSFKSVSEITSTTYKLFPEVFNIGKLIEVWQLVDFTKYFVNSLIIALGAVICSVVFNGIMAYVIAIVKPKGYKIIYYLIMLSYMIPTIIAILPLFLQIVDLGLINSYLPLWLLYGANAFYFVNFKNYFETIPHSLFEAAKIDGCNNLGIFFRVVLPLAKPIIGVVAIFTITAAWSDFLLPYLVLNDESMLTVIVKIYALDANAASSGLTVDQLMMLLTISIIPQILLFALFQKQITGSYANSGVKG